jgi:hypothetical protein
MMNVVINEGLRGYYYSTITPIWNSIPGKPEHGIPFPMEWDAVLLFVHFD